MIIPRYVRNMAERIQIELEKQIQENWNKDESKYSLESIKKIRQQMIEKKGKLFESDDDYINMLEIMTAIIKSSYALSAPASDRVYYEVEIEPELYFALNHAKAVHPRMKEELDSIIKFLEDVPNSVWTQYDAYAHFRIFKLVKTKNQWNKLMKNLSGKDISFNLKYLKIGYVSTETHWLFLEGIALKAQNHLVNKLGKDGFESKREAFETWFRLGTTGTYYIYVPK